MVRLSRIGIKLVSNKLPSSILATWLLHHAPASGIKDIGLPVHARLGVTLYAITGGPVMVVVLLVPETHPFASV